MACSSYFEFLRLRKSKADQSNSLTAPETKLRLALLGDAELKPFTEIIEVLGATLGLDIETYLAPFGPIETEILNQQSDLYLFKPDWVFILPPRFQADPSLLFSQNEDIYKLVEAKARGLISLCEKLRDRTSCQIALCNYVPQAQKDLGSYRFRSLASEWNYLRTLNIQLGLHAPPFIHLCDLEGLASLMGPQPVSNEKIWFESKLAYTLDFQVQIANEVLAQIKSAHQISKKVLALNFDNTLWGGFIGEDGLEGICLGPESPLGEAFFAFQDYVLSLKRRGVALVGLSKNHPEEVEAVFAQHPHMRLSANDFVEICANWNSKPDNLRAAIARLNLGLDSVVFVDDDPVEVEMMKTYCPEMQSLTLHKDASLRVPQLKSTLFFATKSLTRGDTQNTVGYPTEKKREKEVQNFETREEIIDNLCVSLHFAPMAKSHFAKVSQLLEKTNQFNLTDRRRTDTSLSEVCETRGWHIFTVNVRDKFGDYGLVSAVILKEDGSRLEIDTWVMSCRMLNRHVEPLIWQEILDFAKSKKVKRLRAEYRRTVKNALVADLYAKLGMNMVLKTGDRTIFDLELSSGLKLVANTLLESTL